MQMSPFICKLWGTKVNTKPIYGSQKYRISMMTFCWEFVFQQAFLWYENTETPFYWQNLGSCYLRRTFRACKYSGTWKRLSLMPLRILRPMQLHIFSALLFYKYTTSLVLERVVIINSVRINWHSTDFQISAVILAFIITWFQINPNIKKDTKYCPIFCSWWTQTWILCYSFLCISLLCWHQPGAKTK